MNSFVVKCALSATLVGAPLISSGQIRGGTPVRNDVTLLTGPDLLSPSSRPLESPSISSEIVTPARWIPEPRLEEGRQRRASTEERLKQLRAERAAALKRKKELDEAFKPGGAQVDQPGASGTLRLAEPIRFDTAVPVTAPELLRFDSTLQPSPPTPRFEFQRAAKP